VNKNNYLIIFKEQIYGKTTLSNDNRFYIELFNIFEGIKKLTYIIVLCNKNDNKCNNTQI